MHAIIDFVYLHSIWGGIALVGFAAVHIAKWLDTKGVDFVMEELEALRAELHSNDITSQLDASDAVVNILESYIPEVIHEFDDTIKIEVQNGCISSLDWVKLGKDLWAKGKTEVCDGAVNYWKVSGHKDEEALSAIVAKKYFHKQAALQKGLIVPHN